MKYKTPKRAKRVERWTKETLIRELKDLGRRLGRSPKVKDDMSLATGAWKLFGSWNEAKRVAGFKAYPRGLSEYVLAKREMTHKENEAEFLRAFDRPMTMHQLTDKLGWPRQKVFDYIQRLELEGGIRIAKMWLRLGSRGGTKFGGHKLFDGLAAVHIYYLPDSHSHKTALEDMLKKAIDRSPPKGKRAALTYHLKRGLPPDVFEKVHKHYARPKIGRAPVGSTPKGELPEELRGPTLEELRGWWESDRKTKGVM